MSENVILKLTFEFSLLILEYTKLLESSGNMVIAGQLKRSGKSIGANALKQKRISSTK